MPNITMLDIEALKQTKLRPYIEKCLANRAPDPGFHAMMGHNIDLCEAMFVAWDTVFNTGRVSHKLKEIKFYPMFSPDGRLVSQEESAKIYGAAPASPAREHP